MVQGSFVSLPSGQASYAAIDTGTTLVGGPTAVIAGMFAQIPGAAPGTGDYASYWTYRECLPILQPVVSCSLFTAYSFPTFVILACSTQVNVQMSFGGKIWTIDPVDFMMSQLTKTTCIGAFFELEMAGSAPSWIIGDTFLVHLFVHLRFIL